MANNCRITNTSQAALVLPEPYQSVTLPAGGSIVVADTPANVQANFGPLWNQRISINNLDSTDAPNASATKVLAYIQGGSPWTLPRLAEQWAMVGALTATGTVNLPTNPSPGQVVTVKDAGGTGAAHVITVKSTDSSTIDGVAGSTGKALAAANYTSTKFMSDGTNWFTT